MVAPRGQFEPDNDGRDIFRPPAVPIEVTCVHCGEVYDSYRIEWRENAGLPGDAGAWCCPTPGCDGLGFLFDIWPTDPEWRDESGNPAFSFNESEESFPGDPDDDFRIELTGQDSDDGFYDPDEYMSDDLRNAAHFDPTWGDPSNDLPPDPMPPRRPKPPDLSIDEDEV